MPRRRRTPTPEGLAQTLEASRAWFNRFVVQVDPDGELPEEERFRLAREARTAYMRSLADKSREVRQARAAAAPRPEPWQAAAK